MGNSTRGNNRDTTGNSESIISEWETIFDSITDLVSVLDADRRFIRINRPLAKYLGIEPQDVIGKKCHEVMHGTDKPVSYCPIAESTSIKHPVHREIYDSTRKKHFMISLSPVIGRDGHVQSIVHVMRDISKHKLQTRDKQLLESQRVAKLGSWEWDIVQNKITWSDELYNIFGVTPSEFEASYEAFLSMVHPGDKDKLDSAVKESIEKKKPYHIDVRIKRSDGSEWIMEARGELTFDEHGNTISMGGTAQDITERKKAEVELRESEEKYRKLIETANDAIFLADVESGIILDANKKAEEMLGIPLDKIIGMHQTELHPENEIDNYREIFQEHVKEGNAFIRDLLVVHKSGKLVPVDISASVIEIGGKKVLQGVFRDITERKKTEEKIDKYHQELELRVHERTLDIEQINEQLVKQIHDRKEAEKSLIESEMRFRVAATTVTDLLWEGDVRDNSLSWHGDIDRYLGYGNGEFPRTISGHMESIHPDDREWFIKRVDTALKTGEEFRAEYRIRCKDGTYRYWDETGKPIEYEDGKAVKWIGSVTDITDRKNVENQIISSENQFKKLSQEFNALLDAIPDNIVLLDSDLKILWANKAASMKFNINSSNMNGKHCHKLCCNDSSTCENCPVIACFNSGREETARISIPSGDVWDIRAFPVKYGDGHVKNVIEVARDVSLTVKLEKEAGEFQAKLIHANKMTSLGTLVTGVAHEINNPNSFIMTNADLFGEIWNDACKLLDKLDDEYKRVQVGGVSFSDLGMVAPKLIKGIYDGSRRIENIVGNLRDFARYDRGDLYEKVDVNKAVRAACNILDSHIKKHTDNYYLSCRDDIPFIKGNSQQIEQVVVNLIMNSLQALTDRESCVIVSTYSDNRNDQVMIKVEDEGTGISELIMERITEPFFTTKIESGGTGLGLSISYAIIKDHKGSLEFTSEQNKRTVALIKLPACSDDGND
jgi:PAS domain S-box-containing protein